MMGARRNGPVPVIERRILGAARAGRLPLPFDLALLWRLPVDAVRAGFDRLEAAGRIRWDDDADTWRPW